MTVSEYDVVRVTAQIPSDRVSRDFSGANRPRIGDVGTVVLAHEAKPPLRRCFVVECVGADGATLWLADIFSSELERVSSGVTEP